MNIFNAVKGGSPKKNVFDLSHERKFTLEPGVLTPILCEEIVPGDSWRCNTEVLVRLPPMVAPVMHRMNVFTHFFFVPNRIIFDGWKDFITGGEDGLDQTVCPIIALGDADRGFLAPGLLADYLGVNVATEGVQVNTAFSALPFRAYQEIYNEYYRDQNLTDKVEYDKGGGQVLAYAPILTLRRRAWEKDYFTSALPWTQKGAQVVTPLGGSAPVSLSPVYNNDPWRVVGHDRQYIGQNQSVIGSHNVGTAQTTLGVSPLNSYTPAIGTEIDPRGNLVADLTGATASTIEELRRASRLQEWLEKNARGGSRYIESILQHFGVKVPDYRLQRPEYLGGGKSPIVISEVLQTSGTTDSSAADPLYNSPQGNMAGHGVSVGNSHRFTKSFDEHGYIIGIMSVVPKTAYQNGTRRHFMKSDKFDHYWPSFANLGEQPVYDREIFDQNNKGLNGNFETFGYQSRYAEYKYIPSSVHGEFRQSLDHWHQSRQFTQKPLLNSGFVQANPDPRIYAVTDPTKALMYVQCYHQIRAIRPMPIFGIPQL